MRVVSTAFLHAVKNAHGEPQWTRMLSYDLFCVGSHEGPRVSLPPQIKQMALRRPVSVSSISKGRSWLAKVNTRSVSGPKPALCIWVRFRVRPSEKVMVSCSGVYLVQILRIWKKENMYVHLLDHLCWPVPIAPTKATVDAGTPEEPGPHMGNMPHC